MATTGANFVKLGASTLVGGTVTAAGLPAPFTGLPTFQRPVGPADIEAGASGCKLLDRVSIDFASDGFAKHGVATYQLTGTTAQTVDLTDLTANTPTGSAGDTTFATWNTLVFVNMDSADVTIAPGAANPARTLLAGTTPTLTIPANSAIALSSLAGLAVDSTHKIITVTPTSGGNTAGNFAVCVAGA